MSAAMLFRRHLEHVNENNWRDVRAARRMIALSCGIGGLQFVWALLQSSLTPFLLSMGFSESSSALVWSIPPFCGAFIQPLVGRWSDNYRHPVIDRRRPFILGGALVVCVSLMGLSTAEHAVRSSVELIGLNALRPYDRDLTKTAILLWFSLLTLAMQPLQVCSRAYIVENCEQGLQVLANAWASRVQGVCGILGFFLASTPLARLTPKAEQDSGFMLHCTLTSAIVLLMAGTACIAGPSSDSRTYARLRNSAPARVREQCSFLTVLKGMPQAVVSVCLVQWFAWMAWFPFLAYFASYVDDSGTQRKVAASNSIPDHAGNLAGPFAGFLFSIVAFVSSCILPPLFGRFNASGLKTYTNGNRHDVATSSMFRNITSLWGLSQIYFVLAMLVTFAIKSQSASIALIASIGIPWAVSQWIPYAILGSVLDTAPGKTDLPGVGTIMGIHSTAISAPQILSALASSLGLRFAPQQGNVVVWTLRLGGVWMVIAAFLSFRLTMRRGFDINR